MKYILLFNIFILNLLFVYGISNNIYGVPKNQVLSQEQAAKGDMASSSIERIICYKEAMKIWPENYEVVFKLGKVYLSDAKDNEGLELMDKVINSGNKDLQLRAYKCIYKHYNPSTETSKDLVNSDRWLRKITELEPNFLNYYNLGIINGPQGLKNINDSISFFKKAYELKNTQKIVLFYIAENYFMLKDYASALSYIKKYPNANKNHQNAFKLFVTTYYLYSKQDSRISGNALFKCEEYLKTWPNDNEVVIYYTDLKKYAKPSMYADADEISKNDVIPVAKEETTLLKKNEMVPTLISSKTYHSIKETFHLDCQNLLRLRI